MSEEEQVFRFLEKRKARTKRVVEEKEIIKNFLTIPNIYILCKMKSRSIEVIQSCMK